MKKKQDKECTVQNFMDKGFKGYSSDEDEEELFVQGIKKNIQIQHVDRGLEEIKEEAAENEDNDICNMIGDLELQ